MDVVLRHDALAVHDRGRAGCVDDGGHTAVELAAVEVDRHQHAELGLRLLHRGGSRLGQPVGGGARQRAHGPDQVTHELVGGLAQLHRALGVAEVPGQVDGRGQHQGQVTGPVRSHQPVGPVGDVPRQRTDLSLGPQQDRERCDPAAATRGEDPLRGRGAERVGDDGVDATDRQDDDRAGLQRLGRLLQRPVAVLGQADDGAHSREDASRRGRSRSPVTPVGPSRTGRVRSGRVRSRTGRRGGQGPGRSGPRATGRPRSRSSRPASASAGLRRRGRR